MTIDRQDKWDDKAAPRMKDSRRDRLKSALRENLRRRKSQAKERDMERSQERSQELNKVTAAPSNHHENALDDDTGSVGGG
ncbi:hypothetical protein [Bradyrhizobium sp.]|uniref:hypothetical protein n=1 Tax=Bradyrhizobium sp. TaxID=376 RepID=UPI003C5D3384